MDFRALQNEIVEILVLSQYSHWVDKDTDPYASDTAEVIEGKKKKAFDYYLGMPYGNNFSPCPLEQTRFHNLIAMQVGHIFKKIDCEQEPLQAKADSRDELVAACEKVSERFANIATNGGTVQDFCDAGSFSEIMLALTNAKKGIK